MGVPGVAMPLDEVDELTYFGGVVLTVPPVGGVKEFEHPLSLYCCAPFMTHDGSAFPPLNGTQMPAAGCPGALRFRNWHSSFRWLSYHREASASFAPSAAVRKIFLSRLPLAYSSARTEYGTAPMAWSGNATDSTTNCR